MTHSEKEPISFADVGEHLGNLQYLTTFRVVDSGNRTVLIGGIEVRSNGCCRNEVGISLNQTDDITNEVHSDGLPLLKLVAQRTVTARPSKNIYYIDKVIIGIGEDNLVLDARTAEQYLNS